MKRGRGGGLLQLYHGAVEGPTGEAVHLLLFQAHPHDVVEVDRLPHLVLPQPVQHLHGHCPEAAMCRPCPLAPRGHLDGGGFGGDVEGEGAGRQFPHLVLERLLRGLYPVLHFLLSLPQVGPLEEPAPR